MKRCGKILSVLAGMTALAAGSAVGQPGDERRPPDRPPHEGGPGRERPKGQSGSDERRNGRERGPQAEHFLRTYDKDGDHGVTFEEFRTGKKMENMSDAGKKRIFDHLDKNGDGAISRGELPGGAGPRRERTVPGDKNGDGKISFDEFSENPWLKESSRQARRELFRQWDTNGDGFLTAEDFRIRPPGARPWDRRRPGIDPGAMEKLDENKDGALSFEEWRKSPRYREIPEERLKEWFERLDRNNDGQYDQDDRPDGPPPRRGPGQGPGRGPGDGPEKR